MYRKKSNRDTWHWHDTCSNWPTADYSTSTSKPSSGELCNQCKAKSSR